MEQIDCKVKIAWEDKVVLHDLSCFLYDMVPEYTVKNLLDDTTFTFVFDKTHKLFLTPMMAIDVDTGFCGLYIIKTVSELYIYRVYVPVDEIKIPMYDVNKKQVRK